MIADLSEQAVTEELLEITELKASIQKLDAGIRAELAQLQKVLYGNGDPSHSVIARLERIEEAQKKTSDNTSRVSWAVISAIIVQIVLYLLRVL